MLCVKVKGPLEDKRAFPQDMPVCANLAISKRALRRIMKLNLIKHNVAKLQPVNATSTYKVSCSTTKTPREVPLSALNYN